MNVGHNEKWNQVNCVHCSSVQRSIVEGGFEQTKQEWHSRNRDSIVLSKIRVSAIPTVVPFFIFIRLRFGAVKWWHHAHCVYFWLRCGLILAFLQHQRNPFRQSVCALCYILIYTWNISSQKSVIQSKNQALLSFSPQVAAFVCTTQSSSQFLWYYLIHIVRIWILCTTKTKCRNLFVSVLKFRSDAHP